MDFIYNWLGSFRIAGVENNASVAAMVRAQTYFLKSLRMSKL
jgi:hypothetical protein